MEENHKPTKKELKELRKLERMSATSSDSSDKVKWIILGLGVSIFLIFFGFLVFMLKQNQSQAVLEIKNDGWVMGNKDSKVTLVEYGDLQCPSCKAYHPILKTLAADYKDKFKFMFKHFPLEGGHANALLAARAAEAAGVQNKFFEFHDMLFEHQEEWSGLSAVDAEAKFVGYAETLELDLDRFNEDLDNSDLLKKIKAQQAEGINIGVNGTPTFFLNGKRIESPKSLEDFKKLIDEANKNE